MNHWAVFSVAVVLSGAVAYESLHDGLPHGDYNVPAPTVRVLDAAPQTNVAQMTIASPTTSAYQTAAVQFIEVGG